MNNPFDYIPSPECEAAFLELTARIEDMGRSRRPEDINFIQELEAGKMLGVLIAEDEAGMRHTLHAFSGQVGEGGFLHDGFVGPAFDYLQPDGHFKTKEAEISRQNIEIAEFKARAYADVKGGFEQKKAMLDAEHEEFKAKCRGSKRKRDAKRNAGNVTEEDSEAMIRESQYEKAELRRIKKRLEAELEPFKVRLIEATRHLESLKEKRRADSEELQRWLFDNFRLLNARGETQSLSEIFAETPLKVPPSGAGECCAPKLLHAAYRQGLTPVSMAEYWYGAPKEGEVRLHGQHYPACRGKCLPVLGWMLQGLEVDPPFGSERQGQEVPDPEIIFENEWFCVVEKPSGMLSVPGKGNAISVQQWLENRYGTDRMVKVAHRLDQDTSGLLVATFGEQPLKVMQSLFATRQVEKTYIAVLEGDYVSLGLPRRGRIALPLSPDWLDRPRQRVDAERGKGAVTDYEFTGAAEGRSRVTFHPRTGRTHQLRVHAASDKGIGMPIVGDRLYGMNTEKGTERLMLHAHRIGFKFPLDGREYSFESPVPF